MLLPNLVVILVAMLAWWIRGWFGVAQPASIPEPVNTRPHVRRWQADLCAAHNALEAANLETDIFATLQLIPKADIGEDAVLEAFRRATDKVRKSYICAQGVIKEDQQQCQRRRDALALAAKAVLDTKVREWWVARLDTKKGGWGGTGAAQSKQQQQTQLQTMCAVVRTNKLRA